PGRRGLNTGPCAPPSAAAGAGDAGPATDPGTGCAGDEGIMVGPPATLPPVRAGSTPARRHRVLTARLPELSPG
ncbi:hypothetical protein OSJ00_07080, partial [Mycobacterium ulcerans]